MPESTSAILQGTLDLMVLKTLDTMKPMHGYGIARRIEQVSEEARQINQGTIDLCLIKTAWGTSENNRRANFYSISRTGRKQLTAEGASWGRVAGVIRCLLALEGRR